MIGNSAFNNLRGMMWAQQNMLAQPRWAFVDAYDPTNYLVRVRFQPEDRLSGWLPLVAQVCGTTAIIAPPLIGSQVILVPQEGHEDGYAVLGASYSELSLPPVAAAAIGGSATPIMPGEIAAVAGATVMRISPSGIYCKGNLFVEGTIQSSANVIDSKGSLDSLRGHFNTHKHTGVATGTGQSGTTTITDP